MHVYGMARGQVLLKSLSLIRKVLRLPQVLVAVVAISKMRVFPQSNVDAVLLFQMQGYIAVSTQMNVAVFTKGHGNCR
jgi:hypothetical protein